MMATPGSVQSGKHTAHEEVAARARPRQYRHVGFVRRGPLLALGTHALGHAQGFSHRTRNRAADQSQRGPAQCQLWRPRVHASAMDYEDLETEGAKRIGRWDGYLSLVIFVVLLVALAAFGLERLVR